MRARRHSSEILDLRAIAQPHAAFNHARRADISIFADKDRLDDQLITDHARIGDLGLAADTAAFTKGDEINRTGIEIADDRIFTNMRTDGAQIDAHQGRGLEPFEMGEADEALRQPPTVIINAPKRIAPRLGATQDQPFAGNGQSNGENSDADIDTKERDDFGDNARIRAGEQHVGNEHAEPLRRHQSDDEGQSNRLRQATEKAAPEGRRLERQIARLGDMGKFRVEHFGQGTQIARVVNVLQRNAFKPGILAHQRDETRGQERVTAKIREEIRVKGDGLRRQHGFGCIEQLGFGRRARIFLLFRVRRTLQLNLLQMIAVDFTRRQARQFIKLFETCWHHVSWQTLAQDRAQIARINRHLCGFIGDQKSDEFIDIMFAAHNNSRLHNAWNISELGFNLAKLDTEAADFHLIINAPTERNIAIGFHHHSIARAIEHGVAAF